MKNPEKQLILNCEKLETRVAQINKGRLEEYEIERPQEEAIVGSVYLAKIVNHESSLKAAFVDIGAEKNAFLHYWDMLPASYDAVDSVNRKQVKPEQKKKSGISMRIRKLFGKAEVSRNLQEREKRRRRQKISVKDVPQIFPQGAELLVQVTKGPIGTKGARVTTNISIPGRFLVLLPYSDHIGLSSKIDNRKERDRLRKILAELDVPDGMGLICRTSGEGRKSVFFKRDLDMLLDYWTKVETSLERPKVPSLVYREPNLLERTVRDFLTDDIDEIVVDDPEACKLLKNQISKVTSKRSASKVTLHRKATPIFEHYGVTDQVMEIFQREVQLPGGGYICIDETEAMIAIDVNTGRNRQKMDQPEYLLQTNLAAAEEAARQMRVRNIGGLVVIDFIDMRSAKDRDQVYRLMRKLVKEDRAKTKILPISRLGLMEMTRQREHESLKDAVLDVCPYCSGSGRIKSPMTMSVEIQRRLQEIFKRQTHREDLSIRVIIHPSVLARLKNEDSAHLMELEEKFGKNLTFRADPTIHHEKFKIIDPETGVEY